MPFIRPTRTELLADARTEIETRLPGADARLRRSILDVLARVLAGAVHGLYGFLAFIARQAFADTAESEYLRRWAALYGVQELPATYGQGLVEFTGSEAADIPLGTRLRRADQREYQTLEAGSISGGSAVLSVLAVLPGLDGNATAGTVLSLLSPLPGVGATATVEPGGITAGTDVEDPEALRLRLVERLRRPPGGGTAPEYVARAKLYAGVTDVHVFAELVPERAELSIASTTPDVEQNGVYSAKLLAHRVSLLIGWQASLANSETLTLSANLQDATDSAGAGEADFGTAIGPTVVATAPGAGGPHTIRGAYRADFDVRTARTHLRAQITLATSGAGTLVSSTAVLLYRGGPGDVAVAPLFYDRPDPIPTAGDLLAIQDLLEDPAWKPMGAAPLAYALTPEPVAFTIHVVPDTPDIRAAVIAELAQLFRSEATPGGTMLLSHIREAISLAAGETDHVLTVPAANPDLAGDRTKIHTAGTVTWV